MLSKEEIIETIICQLANIRGIVAIFLYGSLASGHFRKGSDVDIAVLFEHNASPDALSMMEMRENLSDHLGLDVDLINLNVVGPLLAMQVIEKGEEILVNDARKKALYFVRLVTDYSDMKDLLKPFERRYFGESDAK